MALIKSIIKQYNKGNNVSQTLQMSILPTPAGDVIVAADESFLYFVSFEDSKNFHKIISSLQSELSCDFEENTNNSIIKMLKEELDLYFKGKLKKFTVPLKTFGSEFQKEVWSKLLELPFSSTQTYGEFAKSIGRPGSARAVGAACGANAHLLVVPCHRLVASTSKGGFSSGVDRKELLLQHEKKHSK